jgi:DNA-binding protein HU-beta
VVLVAEKTNHCNLKPVLTLLDFIASFHPWGTRPNLKRSHRMAENLTKAELVEAVAGAAEITKAAAATAVGCFLDSIAGHVSKGGKVTLVGFGTFSQKVRKARTGRNPQTGAPIKIGASKSMGFKASKAAAAAKKAAPKKAAPAKKAAPKKK